VSTIASLTDSRQLIAGYDALLVLLVSAESWDNATTDALQSDVILTYVGLLIYFSAVQADLYNCSYTTLMVRLVHSISCVCVSVCSHDSFRAK